VSRIYNQVLIHYVDKNGKVGTMFLTTQDQGSGGTGAYSALAAAVQQVTHCAVTAIQFQTTAQIVATASDGDYPSVLDKAVILVGISGEPKGTRIEIPGPKTTIFQADHVTVNLANTDILALQSACQAVLGDQEGHPWGAFKRGNRQMARTQ
jgi:hypothetical protein